MTRAETPAPVADSLGDLGDYVERLENVAEEYINARQLAAITAQLGQLTEDAEADESTADDSDDDQDDEEEG